MAVVWISGSVVDQHVDMAVCVINVLKQKLDLFNSAHVAFERFCTTAVGHYLIRNQAASL